MYIPNPLQCYACFGHHERKCKLYGGDQLCRRCGITSYTHHDENKYTNEIKCVNCGEDHPSTFRTCKIWKREKEVVTIKYNVGLSFPEARKIVEARYNLYFSTVVKTNKNNSVQLKDAQTQTTNASTQTTEPQTKMSTNVNASQKVQAAKKPEKPVAKSPTKSQNKVLSDRLPKGSDDQIQQHNRFHCLEEDMEEATDHAEQITNKQGRNLIKDKSIHTSIVLWYLFTLNSIMINHILQWNCRSVKANFEELNLLIHEKKPVAVCLQETFLKDSDKFSLKYQSCYSKHCGSGDKASGGVAVIVNNSIPHNSVRLDSHLQAVAVSISLNKIITLCSVYLPPSSPLDIKKLDHLIDQLPKPFILMGDFNSHHTSSGCLDPNDKGRAIEDFVTRQDLVLLNNKSSTYLHPATGTYSSLDLTICSPEFFQTLTGGFLMTFMEVIISRSKYR